MSTNLPRILVVEDEPDLLMIVSDLLRAEGYEVECASDGNAGLEAATSRVFDLLVLDVMLPGVDGFSICTAVREQGFDGAILMLTARFGIDDKVHGLRAGADDYLAKPFDNRELMARAAALLRRSRQDNLTPVTRFEFGNITADFARGEVTKAGETVALSLKEMRLLRALIDRRGKSVSREELLNLIWSAQPFITPRTVDVHIAWLRNKLEDDPRNPRYILTIRGEGYRFQR